MNEVQVLPTVLSYDGENQPDILSIIASSAALAYIRTTISRSNSGK